MSHVRKLKYRKEIVVVGYKIVVNSDIERYPSYHSLDLYEEIMPGSWSYVSGIGDTNWNEIVSLCVEWLNGYVGAAISIEGGRI